MDFSHIAQKLQSYFVKHFIEGKTEETRSGNYMHLLLEK